MLTNDGFFSHGFGIYLLFLFILLFSKMEHFGFEVGGPGTRELGHQEITIPAAGGESYVYNKELLGILAKMGAMVII